MKFVKTMLLMTVAAGAVACGNDCGTYIRGQIGGSQGVQTRRDSLLPGSQGGTKSSKMGVYGGLGVETRTPLSHVHSNLIGGFGVDVNLESTKYKQNGTDPVAGTLSTAAKRQVVVNALGQLGWKFKHNIMPYVVAGASYAQFKFSNTWKSTGSTTVGVGKTKNMVGWAGGVGLGWGINHKWSTDVRYLYTAYGKVKTDINLGGGSVNTSKAPKAYHAITVGVSYKI